MNASRREFARHLAGLEKNARTPLRAGYIPIGIRKMRRYDEGGRRCLALFCTREKSLNIFKELDLIAKLKLEYWRESAQLIRFNLNFSLICYDWLHFVEYFWVKF